MTESRPYSANPNIRASPTLNKEIKTEDKLERAKTASSAKRKRRSARKTMSQTEDERKASSAKKSGRTSARTKPKVLYDFNFC